MLTIATAAVFVTVIICTHLSTSKETKTIDLSLMLAAMIGDIILAFIIF